MNTVYKELVVISGKGGTGKTTIAGSLAVCGPQKVIADCDVDAADLHLLLQPDKQHTTSFTSGALAFVDPQRCTSCGLCVTKCRFSAMTLTDDQAVVRRELCEGCGLCAYICKEQAITMSERRCGEWYQSKTAHGSMIHATLGIGEENSGKLVTTVRQASAALAAAQLKELPLSEGNMTNQYVILTDGPPGIGCPVIASLTNAHMALLVIEPCLPALHDAKRVLELTRHFHIPVAVLINKADINTTITSEIRKWSRTEQIPILAELAWTTDCNAAQLNGQTLVEYRPETWQPYFQKMWEQILDMLNTSETEKKDAFLTKTA